MYTANRQCRTCRYCGYPDKGCMAQGNKPRYMPEGACPLYAMSAKAFMERVMNAQRRIVKMEERAAHYREMATSVGAVCSFDGAVSKSGFAQSSMEKNMNAFMAICGEMEAEIERLRGYIRETNEMIAYLPDPREREVLELRYLSGLRWMDISKAMMVDERQTRRLHDLAMEHVQRDMDLIEYAKSRPGWNPGGAGAAAVQ